MSINKHITILILLACVVLTSCAGQSTEAPTLDVGVIMTAGVGTFIANMDQTQTAQALLITNTPSPTVTSSPAIPTTVVPPSTWTPAPVLLLPTAFKSPTATGTQYTPTVDPALSASGCNNLGLIQDVNYPAGSVLNPRESFTKTWKVENNGTCNWIFSFNLVFVSGDSMSGGSTRLSKTIVPGKWTQVSVALKAPSSTGIYTGYWRMQTQTGVTFGATLAVSIIVGNPTDTPEPPTSTVTSYP